MHAVGFFDFDDASPLDEVEVDLVNHLAGLAITDDMPLQSTPTAHIMAALRHRFRGVDLRITTTLDPFRRRFLVQLLHRPKGSIQTRSYESTFDLSAMVESPLTFGRLANEILCIVRTP